MKKIPARLHVLLARDERLGVIFRRGPSKCVATILWDRRKDSFRVGQWLRGRIYERRSDLSADGRYMIYFAMNGRWKSKAKGSWTAISRAPFLKAVALFAKGDCWHGGGLFTSNWRYWLNDGYGHIAQQDSGETQRDCKYEPGQSFGGECPGVYYLRLQRDGWKLVRGREGRQVCGVAVFEKPVAGGWILRKLAHAEPGGPVGKGCYWDEHELESGATGKRMQFPSWEWADVDGRRLVWTQRGQLWTARLGSEGLANEKLLEDFNDMTFKPTAAPY